MPWWPLPDMESMYPIEVIEALEDADKDACGSGLVIGD